MNQTGTVSGQMNNEEMFIVVNNKRLKCGHTTGSCATAASKMAAIVLLGGKAEDLVEITTPKGKNLKLQVENLSIKEGNVTCAVRKDGGDDIDATHGILIYSTVSKRSDGKIVVDGGEGVGRVTMKGLDQPVGNAAINNVPRMMIENALQEVSDQFGEECGLNAVISVPEGSSVSKRTFNPRLGITGGISILGTTGIVEPMSEVAIVDTIKAELNVKRASGEEIVLVVPGNYGKEYSEGIRGIDGDKAVKCSNFIGETIDHATRSGFKRFLLVGNLGKLVKIAGGVMNTHSKWADCRMEIIVANAIIAGVDVDTAKRIMSCVSTDDALDVLISSGKMEATMNELVNKISYHLNHRAGDHMRVEALVFSSKYGKLGETAGAERMMLELGEGGTR